MIQAQVKSKFSQSKEKLVAFGMNQNLIQTSGKKMTDCSQKTQNLKKFQYLDYSAKV
jgi:hypothetical protein